MKVKHLLFLSAAVLAFGCQKTDLSQVNDRMDDLEELVGKFDERISANENALRVITQATANMVYITDVQPFTSADGSKTGWTITFTDKTSITVYNGLNGTDGQDGQTPSIDVEVQEDCVVFILPDKTVTIPLSKPFSLDFKEQNVGIAAGQTLSLEYTITGATPETTVDYIGGLNYKVKIIPGNDGNASGKVELTAPDPAVNDRIAFIADDNNGHTSIKVIVLDALNQYATVTDITEGPIPAEGGTVEATVTSNIDGYTLDIDQAWLTVVGTRAETVKTYTFQAEANETYDIRTATVTVKDAEGTAVQSFSFVQEAKVFDPGDGSEANPYRLRTRDDLLGLRDKLIPQGNTDNPQYVYFEMVNDIDCGNASLYEFDPSGERPIHFDGKGYTLRNVGVHRMTIFGFLWGTVKNLNIDNAHWNGSDYHEGGQTPGEHGAILCATVGLVGWGRNHAGHVENVHITNSSVEYKCNPGDVGWNGSAGIICGELAYEGSSIVNCSAENCTISGDFETGGLVGVANGKCGKVIIENCFTSGTLTCDAVRPEGPSGDDFLNPYNVNSFNVECGYGGGIVGTAHNAEIKNCYSTMTVTNTHPGRGYAGGIVGCVINDVLVENCWAGGNIEGTVNAGGIIGCSAFYHSSNDSVKGSIAWNDLVCNHGESKIGAITGWFQHGEGGNGAEGYIPHTAENNFHKSTLVILHNGEEPADGFDRYADYHHETEGWWWVSGQATDDIIGAAKTIGWDQGIWDLSGATPKLFWQK